MVFAAAADFIVQSAIALWRGEHKKYVNLAQQLSHQTRRRYRKEYQEQFFTVIPGNIYGEWGDFNPVTAPLVNALVAKGVAAVEKAFAAGSGSAGAARKQDVFPAPLPVFGSGAPLRQIIYAGDLAKVLLWSIGNFSEPEPLLVTSSQEFSIREIAEAVVAAVSEQYSLTANGHHGGGNVLNVVDAEHSKKAVVDAEHALNDVVGAVRPASNGGSARVPLLEIAFDTSAPDGPLRRTADTTVFERMMPDLQLTPLTEGILNCVEWYRRERP